MDSLWLCTGVLLVMAVAMLVGYGAHVALTRWVYIPSAKRYARSRGLEPMHWACQPALDDRGTKTEYSVVRLLCRDANGLERIIDVLVWPFGVIRELPVAERPPG